MKARWGKIPGMKEVVPSLYSLLFQVIDYAGLFPPANLPLEPAMRNFIHYQTWPERWMLSRFILPAAKLGELSRLIENGLTWEGTLGFSILGSGNQDGFQTGVEVDVRAVEAFRARFGERVRLEGYETRVPAGGGKEAIQVALTDVIPILHEAELTPFFEAPFGPGWEAGAGHLIHALGEGASDFRAGFKLRTGGVTAEAFPTPEQVAFALCTCRAARVPLKCTAGLHHSIRSFRAEVGTKMHGFLNVFVAGVLAWARGLDQAEVVQVLVEEAPDRFEFSSTGVVWRGHWATLPEITTARREGILTFGSCSFEEPKEDLEALGK